MLKNVCIVITDLPSRAGGWNGVDLGGKWGGSGFDFSIFVHELGGNGLTLNRSTHERTLVYCTIS